MLLEAPDWTPTQGQSYQLKLEQFENTVVNATVLSFTRSGGELLLRLSVSSDVSQVLFMRTCQAELGEYVSSMLVPSRCIFRQGDTTGVVVIDGMNQTLVPVTIIKTEGANTYIEPGIPGILYEGQTVRMF